MTEPEPVRRPDPETVLGVQLEAVALVEAYLRDDRATYLALLTGSESQSVDLISALVANSAALVANIGPPAEVMRQLRAHVLAFGGVGDDPASTAGGDDPLRPRSG